MLTEDKITENFVMADEFCKVFNEILRMRGLQNVSRCRLYKKLTNSVLTPCNVQMLRP